MQLCILLKLRAFVLIVKLIHHLGFSHRHRLNLLPLSLSVISLSLPATSAVSKGAGTYPFIDLLVFTAERAARACYVTSIDSL